MASNTAAEQPKQDGSGTTESIFNKSAFAAGSSGTSLPPVTLPSGGGSMRGIGETFLLNQFDGTSSWNVPLKISECRSGAQPQLSLTYSTGNGTSAFGLGWSLSGPGEISRKTTRGLPKYLDQEDSDIFTLSGTEDLVPQYRTTSGKDGTFLKNKQGRYDVHELVHDGFIIRRYRPRIDSGLSRIERWTSLSDPNDVHWKQMTPSNEVMIFGLDKASRVELTDADGQSRIFSWLMCQWRDSKGNAILYEYKAENKDSVNFTKASEAHRANMNLGSQKYLKRVKYGLRKPLSKTELVERSEWMFELVFDYGEHDQYNPQSAEESNRMWRCRKDPFSTYKAGFEVRNYRLCQRVLMFHHFPDDLGRRDYLVNSLELTHREDESLTILESIQSKGHMIPVTGDLQPPPGQGPYISRALPQLDFQYTAKLSDKELSSLQAEPVAGRQDAARNHQWVDLLCEGITGMLIEENMEWYYRRNLSPRSLYAENLNDIQQNSDWVSVSNIDLAPRQLLGSKPSLLSSDVPVQLLDLQGDGHLDAVFNDTQPPGFFRCTFDSRSLSDTTVGMWGSYQAFSSMPNIDMKDPDLRMIDLTGDGKADILITHNDALIWYESQGKEGYQASANVVSVLQGDDRAPHVLFRDATQSIHLADFSGDGLVDIVRIRNGNICYWPNLGYGKFGSMVTMDNSPIFENDDGFSTARLLLGDVDGSGSTDIIYFGSTLATVYYNLAGNGFAAAVQLSSLGTQMDNSTKVSAIDLLGTGTMSLVFTSTRPTDDLDGPMKYVDLMGGVKPYLLSKVSNNIGSETKFTYCSSVAYYMQDEAEGRPWCTRLPYPQHCIDRVISEDKINRTVYTRRFRYHHGYYDSFEREFRGFGMVEEWDTESFESLSQFMDSANINRASFLPPKHTKTWYHLGAFTDHEQLSKVMAVEYYRDPNLGFDEFYAKHQLRDVVKFLTQDVSNEERRQASRALKGSTLRVEVYSDDENNKDRAFVPYLIQDFGSTVNQKQPLGIVSPFAIYAFYQREALVQHLERQVTDSRRGHEMVLEVDKYGNPLKKATIAYGRLKPDPELSPMDQITQARSSIIVTDCEFTNAIDGSEQAWSGDYLNPQPFRQTTFEVTNLKMTSTTFSVSDFDVFASLPEVAYDDHTTTSMTRKRVLRLEECVYKKNDLSTLLPLGVVESLALPGQSYQLKLTPSLLSQYRRGSENLLPNPEVTLNETGHVDVHKDGRWWTKSSMSFYDRQITSTVQELSVATQNFFQPVLVVDQYGAVSVYKYDKYSLKLIKQTDAIGNTSSVEIDYRVLQAKAATDLNGNRSACTHDALGCVVATAVTGKPNANQGDNLNGSRINLSLDTVSAFFDNPVDNARALLAGATSRFIYGYDTIRNNTVQPLRVAEIVREKHVNDVGGKEARLQIKIAYMNSMGGTIQTKILAEPDDAGLKKNQWLCSGWSVYNNKGLPVQEFEPFFSQTPDFTLDHRVGVSSIIFYDALDRQIGSLLPNKSWSKVEHGVWETKTWDTNDTVLLDPQTDPTIGTVISRIVPSIYQPTWYATRIAMNPGTNEARTAMKTAKHANTYGTTYIGASGITFLSTLRDEKGDNVVVARQIHDSDDTLIEIQDPLGRVVDKTVFDMVGGSIRTASMDTGKQWTFATVTGEIYLRWNERGNTFHQLYDALGRPTTLSCENSQEGISQHILRSVEYGEGEKDPETQNLRGKVYSIRDQDGLRVHSSYDFKGNTLVTQRTLPAKYSERLDWTNADQIELESHTYVTRHAYDALSREIRTITPDRTVIETNYNQRGYLQSQRCNVRNEHGSNGDLSWTWAIKSATYDSHGKTMSETYGNNVSTVNQYDPRTFRLSRVTVRSGKSTVQDCEYTYDPVGNNTFIQNNAQQTVFFRNTVVEPHNEFTYDAMYRLIEATGREHLGLTKGHAPGPDLDDASGVDHTANGQSMARYKETYTIDVCNNIRSIRHEIADSRQPGWTRYYDYQESSKIDRNVLSNQLTATRVGNERSSYRYDVQGNIVAMPHLSFVKWDPYDRINSLSRQRTQNGAPVTTWYNVNHEGQRVRKVTGRHIEAEDNSEQKSSETIYLDQYEIYREYSGTDHVSKECQTIRVGTDDKFTLVVENWSGSKNKAPPRLLRYQLQDECESIVIELDDAGQVISSEEFSPFGSTTFQSRKIAQAPKRYRFSGKERDKESGLDHYTYRYYIPWLGRWMSFDPIGLGDGYNGYVYVHNNPLTFTDRSGLSGRGGGKKGGKGKRKLDDDGKKQSQGKFQRTDSDSGSSKSDDEDDDSNSQALSKASSRTSLSNSSQAGDFSDDDDDPPAYHESLTPAKALSKRNGLLKRVENFVSVERSHMIPKKDPFKAKFAVVGLNVDDYTIVMSTDMHKEITNVLSQQKKRTKQREEGLDPHEEGIPGVDYLWKEWLTTDNGEWVMKKINKLETNKKMSNAKRESLKGLVKQQILDALESHLEILGMPTIHELKNPKTVGITGIDSFWHSYKASGQQSSEYRKKEFKPEHLRIYRDAMKQRIDNSKKKQD